MLVNLLCIILVVSCYYVPCVYRCFLCSDATVYSIFVSKLYSGALFNSYFLLCIMAVGRKEVVVDRLFYTIIVEC